MGPRCKQLSPSMLTYAITIFTGAFLLFQVEPLLARYILPWFGGTSAVWITCMLFFQLLLVAGYAYSHLIATRLTARRQAIVHVAIVFSLRPADGRARADMAIANHARSDLEASESRFPRHENLRPPAPQCRVAVLHPVHDGSAAAGLVCAVASRIRALSPVRTIQYRIVARAGDLSIRGGTGSEPESTSASVVAAVWLIFDRRIAMCAQYSPRHFPGSLI